MPDRRLQPRFVSLAPADARIQVIIDAVIESWEGDRAVAIISGSAACGDEFVMQFPSPLGALQSWTVRVLACEPTVIGTAKRFRLHLSLTPAPPTRHGDSVFVA